MPNPFLYKNDDDKHILYIGQFSTADGLRLLNEDLKIVIEEFGATLFKNYGWATETDIPKCNTVRELVDFLDSEGEIGLVTCTIHILETGILHTHDDSECHFTLKPENLVPKIISGINGINPTLLIARLLEWQSQYIELDGGLINRYPSFEKYLEGRV